MEINRSTANPTFQGVQKNVKDKDNITVAPRRSDNSPNNYNIDEIKENVASFNKFMETSNTNLKFSLHEELNEYYVAIVDVQTNEVIKEIPPKKLLDFFATMKKTIGLFIDEKI
ncbi:flagellar protein FlaG [Halalkalibacter akibai]|uniref:Flagellar protein FlaG n=1 Tax=Halalkalibacter akibai (strain ATCC 43226 / DSM 21942 / CIP 109018 / JCM 9157 / 1139) TaxID=1236973 RepID=W4QNY1_HALA3|nr:flagellar protein FlaG [Halalkalibacter akibai]GAE33039.1 flagellar protein FlaG [Halalkalibacter akibai JCM 9157]